MQAQWNQTVRAAALSTRARTAARWTRAVPLASSRLAATLSDCVPRLRPAHRSSSSSSSSRPSPSLASLAERFKIDSDALRFLQTERGIETHTTQHLRLPALRDELLAAARGVAREAVAAETPESFAEGEALDGWTYHCTDSVMWRVRDPELVVPGGGAEELVLDLEEFTQALYAPARPPGDAFCAMGDVQVSPCGGRVAFTVLRHPAQEWMHMYVKDMRTGRIDWAAETTRVHSMAWLGEELFYCQVDALARPFRVRRLGKRRAPRGDGEAGVHAGASAAPRRHGKTRSAAGSGAVETVEAEEEDEVVFEEKDAACFVDVSSSKDRRFLIVSSNSKSSSEVHVLLARHPDTAANEDASGRRAGLLRCVRQRERGLQYFVEHSGEHFWIVSNQRVSYSDGAPQLAAAPQLTATPQLVSPQLAPTRIASPYQASPHLASPQTASPQIAPPQLPPPQLERLSGPAPAEQESGEQELGAGAEHTYSVFRVRDDAASLGSGWEACAFNVPCMSVEELDVFSGFVVTYERDVRSASQLVRISDLSGRSLSTLRHAGAATVIQHAQNADFFAERISVTCTSTVAPPRTFELTPLADVVAADDGGSARASRPGVEAALMSERVFARSPAQGFLSQEEVEGEEGEDDDEEGKELEAEEEEDIDLVQVDDDFAREERSPPRKKQAPRPSSSHPRRQILDRGGEDGAHRSSTSAPQPSRDSVMVPITLTRRRDLAPSNDNPCLVVSYGAYGESLCPTFDELLAALALRGWVIAHVHVRGGSEKGRGWYHAGRAMRKRSGEADLESAIMWLQRPAPSGGPGECKARIDGGGWTRPGLTAVSAASAGAVSVAALANRRPGLLAAVSLRAPFVDVLATMLDASLPLTVAEYDEWGRPGEDAEAREYIEAYDPVINAGAGCFPNGCFSPRPISFSSQGLMQKQQKQQKQSPEIEEKETPLDSPSPSPPSPNPNPNPNPIPYPPSSPQSEEDANKRHVVRMPAMQLSCSLADERVPFRGVCRYVAALRALPAAARPQPLVLSWSPDDGHFGAGTQEAHLESAALQYAFLARVLGR